jgi:hypothetical protein
MLKYGYFILVERSRSMDNIETGASYWLVVSLLWGWFGILVETLWTMLRKFKNKLFNMPFFRPARRFVRQISVRMERKLFKPLRIWWRSLWKDDGAETDNLQSLAELRQKKEIPPHRRSPFSLITETNGWTFIMFATGMPLLLLLSHNLISGGLRSFSRALIYGLGFWGAELLWGTVIEWLGARIPWDYSASRWSMCGGKIRLDYLPAWSCLGLLIEHYFSFWHSLATRTILAEWPHAPSFFPVF